MTQRRTHGEPSLPLKVSLQAYRPVDGEPLRVFGPSRQQSISSRRPILDSERNTHPPSSPSRYLPTRPKYMTPAHTTSCSRAFSQRAKRDTNTSNEMIIRSTPLAYFVQEQMIFQAREPITPTPPHSLILSRVLLNVASNPDAKRSQKVGKRPRNPKPLRCKPD